MARRVPVTPIRLLVLARAPFRPEDLAGGDLGDVEQTVVVHRVRDLPDAIDDLDPTVVVVDTSFSESRWVDAIDQAHDLAPDAGVLALTPSPAPEDDVARAIRAGAIGFIEAGAEPSEIASAVRAAHRGESWLPPDETRAVLGAVASNLEVTGRERRGRLTGIVLALIPLAGIVAAILSLLWRKYLGQIGVRPVDIAVDPSSRVIDAVEQLFLLLGVFGPLVFVNTWLELLRRSAANRGALGWLLAHRRLAAVLMVLVILTVTSVMAIGPDLALVVLVGPGVGLALLAHALGLDDQLPEFLRIQRVSATAVAVGGVVVLLGFFALVVGEVYLRGPEFGRAGARGWIAPRVIGFKAQPVRAINVETGGPPREVLYLGGNADLYVLVDPCDGNEIDMVSVGRHRLEVIDDVTCPE